MTSSTFVLSAEHLMGSRGWQQPKLREPVVALQRTLNDRGLNLSHHAIVACCQTIGQARAFESRRHNISGRIIKVDNGEVAIIARQTANTPPQFVLFKRGNVLRKSMASALERMEMAVRLSLA